jgi:pimeloyl-ACP methyl ester carboxylesterase
MTINLTSTITGRAAIDGGDGRSELWFEEAGSGPAVILAHSGSTDARIWDEVFSDLRRDHRAVRYDARGRGRSTSIAGDYSPSGDLLTLLDHLGIDRALIIGNSLGGLTGIDLALEHPGRVSGLVLAGPGLSGYTLNQDAAAWQRRMRNAGQAALQAAQSGGDLPAAVASLVEVLVEGELDGPHRTPNQVDAALRARVVGIVGEMVMTHHSNHGEMIGPQAVGRLAELTTPTLVVMGSLDFTDLLDIADLIASQAPNARKVVLDGVGHLVQTEAPARFLSQTRPFLAEIEATV